MNVADLVPALIEILPAHLARQRWYGAKHRDGVELEVLAAEELRAPWPAMVRMVVQASAGREPGATDDYRGPSERYQLIIGLRPVDEPIAVGESAVVGVIRSDERDLFVYDALVDPELGLALLHHVAPASEATTVRQISAEQSNTSLVFDEHSIMKVFRRLTGANPEIEVTVALAGTEFNHIAEPLAVWRTSGDDLAIVQRFLAGGVDGWALALTSVRDLLSEGADPAAAGGDLAPEGERLGVVTAELHLALAEAFGTAPGRALEWAGAIAERVRSVHHREVDPVAVERALERLRSLEDVGSAIRVHGDYHLGQVMRTDEGWFVLDFEGEPARPVEERRTPTSPLRDVAGMLRSFAYAAAVGSREHGSLPVDGDPNARPHSVAEVANAWEVHNRDAFLTAYLARLEGSALLPADLSSTRAVLAAFELDKAIYEVAYEQAHRPDWVQIPLDAVRRLTDT